MKDKIHYLYRHIRVDKNEPFYIGIGTIYDNDKFSKTETIIYRRAFSLQRKNNIWKKINLKSKYIVEIMLESFDYDIIKNKEIEFINLYGRIDLRTGTLSNLTIGGDGTLGCNNSEEFKRKCSERMKGTKHSEITKKKECQKLVRTIHLISVKL